MSRYEEVFEGKNRLAKRAGEFGRNVVAYRKSGKPSELAEVKSSLSEAVKAADYPIEELGGLTPLEGLILSI